MVAIIHLTTAGNTYMSALTTEQTSIALLLLLLNRVAELEKELQYDKLTGVKSQSALISKWQNHESVTVIAVDVKGLGEVNRRQGHHEGDLLLQRVALDLKACVRSADLVYRRGGDEFLLIIPNTSSVDIEQRIRNLPYDLYIGVSSGDDKISNLAQVAFSQVESQKLNQRAK